MTEQQQSLDAIHDIKKMMERSSRFISLSGLSGVSAGICALIGSMFAYPYVYGRKDLRLYNSDGLYTNVFNSPLFWIAIGTFIAALITAFIFTYLKSKKDGTPIWGNTARRLIINVSIPLLVGAIFILNLMEYGTFGLVAPGCLLFYGLALINASKYTLNEIRYLGYAEIVLGLVSLNSNFIGYGLYFWAVGFGILHIMYGVYMWYNYEREN